MNPKKHERGQGVIEYLLLVAVVLVALIAFSVAYKDSTNDLDDATGTAVNDVAASAQ